jgi:hypothetical protein
MRRLARFRSFINSTQGFDAYCEMSALTQRGLKKCFDTAIKLVLGGGPTQRDSADNKCILC